MCHDEPVVVSHCRPDHGYPGSGKSPRLVTQEIVELRFSLNRALAQVLLSPHVLADGRCEAAKPWLVTLIKILGVRSIAERTEYVVDLVSYRDLLLRREAWPQRFERDAISPGH